MTTHLLAELLHETRVGSWQRGGGKTDYPTPIARPGVSGSGRRISDEQAERLKSIVANRWSEED